jgi:tRNA dimethylallyltransferase
MTNQKPLVLIVGPTAVGKTRVSLALAAELEGEIVSADSRLVYRSMDIGTAKPTLQERKLIPHHLIDLVDPTDTYSLARYRREALAAISQIHQRQHLPLLVGGTGQYVRAVIEGWVPPPRPQDLTYRRRLEQWTEKHGHRALHARLERVDPDRAAAIDARNIRRVIRALEIYQLTGVPPSKLRVKQPPPYDILQIGLSLDRDQLYQRIDSRIESMLAAGWLDEIRGILAAGVPVSTPALSAIGYRQLVDHLQGNSSLDEAVNEIKRLSRQFVRRQANWFKQDDPDIHWFEAYEGVAGDIQPVIERWLDSGASAETS